MKHSTALRRRSLAFDGALAAGAALLAALLAAGFIDDVAPAWRWAAAVLLAIHTLSLAMRRVAPRIVFGVNVASGLGVVATGVPIVVLHVTPLLALYAVAASEPRSRSVAGAGVSVVAMMTGEMIAGWPSDVTTVAGNVIVIAATWLAGSFAYERHAHVSALEAKTRELAAAREELAHRAVTEERLRIARELHDVVAHSLGMIAVQSGVGAHVMDSQPEEARQALLNIEAASRSALNEMRRLVGVLRDGDGNVSLAPLPGLDRLQELTAEVSRSGVAVTLDIAGAPHSLPAAIDAALYRVVQEALTNVVRHAGATAARVAISYAPGAVRAEVVDDGTASVAAGFHEGHGIAGIRERTRLLEGTVEVGPLREGGFRVAVELPANGTAP